MTRPQRTWLAGFIFCLSSVAVAAFSAWYLFSTHEWVWESDRRVVGGLFAMVGVVLLVVGLSLLSNHKEN
ncbi:MAG: hypothetical protein K2Z80_37320 [Xanthobacteraceae bacterium]|nr:hypothetical protein [Xanthobacteraceae bacterium]